MLKTMKNFLIVLVLPFMLIPASLAQQPDAGSAKGSGDDFVTEKGFKSKIFEVKHRDARNLATVVRQLGSGFQGASISASSEFNTITARDFPENLVVIEQAIARLDTPAPARRDVELHIHVLIASNTPGNSETTAQVPAEIRDVVTQLGETLTYRNYELAASIVQRLTETPRGLRGTGTAEISGGNPSAPGLLMPYQYGISEVSLLQNATGAPSVRIGEFSFTTNVDKDQAQVQTALTLRNGEKVVVGTATLRNRALVIVLTAKTMN